MEAGYLEPYRVMTISTAIHHPTFGDAMISVSLVMEVKTVHETEEEIRRD